MSYEIGDMVQVTADQGRDGKFVGLVGRISSNTLDGIVWVHLGMKYANFHEDGLEPV